MINIIATILFAAAMPAERPAQPALVGYMPVTIKSGTNVVENLPATTRYQPQLKGLTDARAGDTVMWNGESHTFDGKVWSGKNGGEAKIPIPAKFMVVRTAKETDVWNIGFEIDMTKAPPKEEKKAR